MFLLLICYFILGTDDKTMGLISWKAQETFSMKQSFLEILICILIP